MQPECAEHPQWGRHRHCPRCDRVVVGTPAIYVEHCWVYCEQRRKWPKPVPVPAGGA